MIIFTTDQTDESIFDGISERTFIENENEEGWIMPEREDENETEKL